MYKCSSCGYTSNKFFALCPKCKDGLGEEILEEQLNNAKLSISKNLQIKRVDKNIEQEKASRYTQYKNFNAILSSSKGLINGQVILLAASPGVGKSTLCMSISDRNTLYISSEENYKQVNARAIRVNPNCDCEIFNSTHIEDILEAIQQTKSDLIIVDSLNSIDFGVGYLTTARYADQITSLIKSLNKICIIISQVAKNGEISGLNAIMHIVDTIIYLERSEISANIIATSTKNRYGEIGGIAIFMHDADGFEEIDAESFDDKPVIGLTKTDTRFGHKNMTIGIEALVASSQSPYGLRKANGYNQNRLIQLIGILSYFGKINFLDRDIYINISNGLYTDDICVELAMANSILSSFYGKALISKAYGEIRLNGKIVNGSIDEKPIYNIIDLINLYKK